MFPLCFTIGSQPTCRERSADLPGTAIIHGRMDLSVSPGAAAAVMWSLGGLLFATGALLYFVDRHGLSRGRVRAFRRGFLIASTRFQQFAEIEHTTQTLRTRQGEGRWLTGEVFGFWAREGYRYGTSAFAWVGVAALQGGDLLFEVRLLRSRVLQRAAVLTVCLALPATLAAGGFGVVATAVAAGVSMLALRTMWKGFQRERWFAREIVREFGTRLQQPP